MLRNDPKHVQQGVFGNSETVFRDPCVAHCFERERYGAQHDPGTVDGARITNKKNWR